MIQTTDTQSISQTQTVSISPISAPTNSSLVSDPLIKTIACIFCAIVLDLCLLPGAFACLVLACSRVNFNPALNQIKPYRTPILLLHGSSFNESEWLIGRLFLRKTHYGSVFSMNYDGLIIHDPLKGIEDYAEFEVSNKIKEVTRLTQSNEIIIIGHSMGGLIASYYAEFCAIKDRVIVNHVFTIGSPWQGAPMIDFLDKYWPFKIDFKRGKRHHQMSVRGGTACKPKFRHDLVEKAKQSERTGLRCYYNLFSKSDILVPGRYGAVSEFSERKRCFALFGHYSIIVMPQVWFQIQTWLNDIYTKD